MIQVVDIKKITQKKYKVYTDHKDIAFVVYKGDLPKYGIIPGKTITNEQLNSLYKELILPRAKRRGMYLLQAREYSVYSLSEKLRKDGYPENIVQQVVSYLESYHYLDDNRYVRAYLRSYSHNKSLNEMKRVLRSKGISGDVIEQALFELKQDGVLSDERVLIERYIVKRKYNIAEATLQEKNKMFIYLCNKGFDYNSIKACLGDLQE